MDIFKFAMKQEKTQAKLYRTWGRKAKLPGLKRILEMLAKDEDKHFRIVRAMGKSLSPKMTRTPVLSKARSIFAKMKKLDFAGGRRLEPAIVFNKALSLEEKSRVFYLKKSKEATSKAHRDLFLVLSQEEKKHWILIENIIEFVSKPKTWIENAEFNHLEDY